MLDTEYHQKDDLTANIYAKERKKVQIISECTS